MITQKTRREVIVTIDRRVYAVVVPSFCLVPISDIYYGMRYMEEIDDMVYCVNCLHYKEGCVQWKEKLEHVELSRRGVKGGPSNVHSYSSGSSVNPS